MNATTLYASQLFPPVPTSGALSLAQFQRQLVAPDLVGASVRVDLPPQLLRDPAPVLAIQIDHPNLQRRGPKPDADLIRRYLVHTGQRHVDRYAALLLLVREGHVGDLGPGRDAGDPVPLLLVGFRQPALVHVVLLLVEPTSGTQCGGRMLCHGELVVIGCGGRSEAPGLLAARADLAVLRLEPHSLLQVLPSPLSISEQQPRPTSPVHGLAVPGVGSQRGTGTLLGLTWTVRLEQADGLVGGQGRAQSEILQATCLENLQRLTVVVQRYLEAPLPKRVVARGLQGM
mmetsp:Transcript_173936/g.557535  ORF Transcript_173936/g.557535 Transcript_173936/m.557535 type:complete len:287 (+) Transcript_173936:3-863(+)